jgi:hypothetical protein
MGCNIPSNCWYTEPGEQWWQYYAVCTRVQAPGVFRTEVHEERDVDLETLEVSK